MDQARVLAAAAAAQAAGSQAAGSTQGLIAAAATTKPQREVFGFVNASNLGNPSVGYQSWNMDLLTTVAYFDVTINSGDGQFVTNDTGWSVLVSSVFSNFVATAHAHGTRVIVSFNMHDFGTNPSGPMCQALQPTSVANTVKAIVTAVNGLGIDGANLNYEGTLATCANGATNRAELVSLAQNLRAAMPGKYMAIDSYSGSAEDNLEFFDVTGLAPYIDAFFVMAYDMDYANAGELPLSCTSYCFNPISPLNTYRFNVSKSIAQYTALVPASKVIIGQPLYGRRGCVQSLSVAHQYPIPGKNFVTPTYAFASTIPSQTGVSNFAAHRDPGDGVSEWDTWYDSDWACNREQYFDDTYSFAAKFDLIDRTNIRGVGFFTLDYAGGAAELWSEISNFFSCPVTVNAPATSSTTAFNFGLTAGTCSVAYFEAQVHDDTLNQGWEPLTPIAASAGNGTGTAFGYAGHTYDVRVRAHTTQGIVSAWAFGTTAIASTATNSQPYSGLLSLDAYGGVHANDSGPLSASSYWGGWNIARAAHAQPGPTAPQSGFVLDGWGGLHPYGAPGLAETTDSSTHYWKGWDIARDFAFLPDGTGGFVLDGYGGLHPFRVNGNTAALSASGNTYWPGQDVARKVVIFADGTGGYVLDLSGGLHPFGINRTSPVSPASTVLSGYWANQDIARDVVLVPGDGGHSGYVLDLYGGLHPFHVSNDGSTMPATIATAYWWGNDLARGVWLLPGSATAGYTLDAWGGPHAFGGAPPIVNHPYWPNTNLGKAVWGA